MFGMSWGDVIVLFIIVGIPLAIAAMKGPAKSNLLNR